MMIYDFYNHMRELRFANLIWKNEPIGSGDLVKLCEKEMDEKMKKPYANSLLSLAAGKPILNGSPLAFGEGNVIGRIKNVLNYKKAPFWMIVASVIMVVGMSIGLLTNPKVLPDSQVGNEEPTNQEDFIEPTSASWFLHQITGTDMAMLDYASDDMILFHGYFGLYVYDLGKREIIQSLDLEAINCERTQGDDYCDVVVSKDGNIVQLHPMSSDNISISFSYRHYLYKSNR